MKTYQIIYLVRGERHRLLRGFSTMKEAKAALLEVRAAGWQAWIE